MSERMTHWPVEAWEIRIMNTQIASTWADRNTSVMQRDRCRWAIAGRRRLEAAAA